MRLLVVRFSALGDVAMTVPVLHSLARRYPQLQITVVSRPFVESLFASLPSNVRFRGVDVKRYPGLWGLWRLFHELRREGVDAVADLHDVLRTQVLRTLFRLAGKRTASIDKGRSARRALVRQGVRRKLRQLPTSFARYEAVFARLGYPVQTDFRSIYPSGRGEVTLFQQVACSPDGKRWIGLAPFAAHRGKMLPAATVEALVSRLAYQPGVRLFLFGGGPREREVLERLSAAHANVQSVAGRLRLDGELALMSHLDVMLSMDSANMHLASLVGTRVVSVWGATHPFAGFLGWGQRQTDIVQLALPCRPCSIFGNKPCLRGDYACLTGISVEQLVERILGQ